MRWLFQCFEGIGLHHMTLPDGTHVTQALLPNNGLPTLAEL
jgi:hypothetical protein